MTYCIPHIITLCATLAHRSGLLLLTVSAPVAPWITAAGSWNTQGTGLNFFFCFLTFLFFTLWFKHDRHHTLLLADYGCDEMEGGCDVIRCVIGGYFFDYLNLHPPQNFVMTVQTDVLKIIR